MKAIGVLTPPFIGVYCQRPYEKHRGQKAPEGDRPPPSGAKSPSNEGEVNE